MVEMKILVTGGTGFVGQRLVKRLRTEGHQVIVLSKDRENARELFNDDVETIEGDLLDLESLKKLGRKRFDFVYHLAAIIDETSPDMWKVNVEGTRNLIDAIKGKKLQRIIYLSSIGVLGETRTPAKEDFPYNPETRYEESKAEAERVITYAWLKYKIPYTIIRSTIIYGPNKIWSQIINAAKKGYPLIGSGNNYFHLVYVDDVIDALVLALDPIATNKIYHIAGPDPRTYKETYQIICKILGVKFPKTRIPKPIAMAGAMIYKGLSKMRRMDVTLLPSSILRLTRNRIVDTSLAEKELGWKPKYDLEEGMKLTIRELEKEGLV